MGRFKFQLLLKDETWSTWYNIPKKDSYSESSTKWTPVRLNFTLEKFGTKLFNDDVNSANSVLCFSNITITHSVY